MPASILAVHQGHELYGSDRVFLQTLDTLSERLPDLQLTIVLPRDGVLAAVVRQRFGSVTIDEDLCVLRRAELREMGPGWVLRLFRGVRRALTHMHEHDLVLINTVTVADYLVASRFSRTPTVVHVHELVTGLERPFYAVLLTLARASFMFISRAARDSFFMPPWRRTRVIHNGVPAVTSDTDRLREPDPGAAPVRLLIIGRISHRKGQRLALQALARLPVELRERWHLRIVGGFYGNDAAPGTELEETIRACGLETQVDIVEFTPQPSPHYAWSQLVIVPSSRPEPFGLSAVEAMAHGRAVIGARHGGLTEIVRDGSTGRLFTPNDADALAAVVADYLRNPGMIAEHGRAARRRQQTWFSADSYRAAVSDFVNQTLPPRLRACDHDGQPDLGASG